MNTTEIGIGINPANKARYLSEDHYLESLSVLPAEQVVEMGVPTVYDFTDYRKFLKASFLFRRAKNASYSETAFIKAAGFGPNSRGYFSLIMKGKRNLSAKTILGFSQSLKLDEKEAHYFESLVLYNQAKTEKDKSFYFERMKKFIRGSKTRAFELLSSQYNYFSRWYTVAIRELVSHDDFEEDQDWIRKKLRNRISKKQVQEAIADLLNLGMLSRRENGKLYLNDELVQFTDTSLNYTIVNQIHGQMLDLSRESLFMDNYEDRSISNVVLACDSSHFPEIRQEIKEFRRHIMKKYGANPQKVDCVLGMGLQLYFLTDQKNSSEQH